MHIIGKILGETQNSLIITKQNERTGGQQDTLQNTQKVEGIWKIALSAMDGKKNIIILFHIRCILAKRKNE